MGVYIQEMSVEEKRSGDRAVWLEWLSRYSHRLHRDLDYGTHVSKVHIYIHVANTRNCTTVSMYMSL